MGRRAADAGLLSPTYIRKELYIRTQGLPVPKQPPNTPQVSRSHKIAPSEYDQPPGKIFRPMNKKTN